MTMNKKCKWKRLQKVEERQSRGVEGIDYKVGTVYANHAEKMTKVQLHVNFLNSIYTLPKSHMHTFNVSIITVQSLKNVSLKV
jgi:hypothetical protein